jgi:hypothetical protein
MKASETFAEIGSKSRKRRRSSTSYHVIPEGFELLLLVSDRILGKQQLNHR